VEKTEEREMKDFFSLGMAVAAGFFLSQPAAAAITQAQKDQTMACTNTLTRSYQEMHQCLYDVRSKAEAALKVKYDAVNALARMADHRSELASSQKAWQLYVTQTCRGLVEPYWRGAKIQEAETIACEIDLTNERTDALDRIFHVPLHR